MSSASEEKYRKIKNTEKIKRLFLLSKYIECSFFHLNIRYDSKHRCLVLKVQTKHRFSFFSCQKFKCHLSSNLLFNESCVCTVVFSLSFTHSYILRFSGFMLLIGVKYIDIYFQTSKSMKNVKAFIMN